MEVPKSGEEVKLRVGVGRTSGLLSRKRNQNRCPHLGSGGDGKNQGKDQEKIGIRISES